MRTRLIARRSPGSLKWRLASVAAALLLAAGLFMASVFLPSQAAPAHVLNPPAASAALAPQDDGVNGTLASFTALIPEMATIHLPIITR
jgi:hypothetical protein